MPQKIKCLICDKEAEELSVYYVDNAGQLCKLCYKLIEPSEDGTKQWEFTDGHENGGPLSN